MIVINQLTLLVVTTSVSMINTHSTRLEWIA